MKKLLSLTLVAVMLCTTLMLTSCEAVMKLAQLYYIMDMESNIRYTVTEEEWNDTINLENYTTTCITNITGKEVSTYYKFTKDGCHLNSDEEEKFYVFKEDACYFLKQSGEELVASWVGYAKTYKILPFWLSDLSLNDFTYNESKHAYVLTEVSNGFESNIEIRFENGVIFDMNITIADESETIFQNYTFYSVGTTTVEFPQYTMGE